MARQSAPGGENQPAARPPVADRKLDPGRQSGVELAAAISTELRCYQAEIEFLAADNHWAEIRQTIIDENPAARQAQSNYRQLAEQAQQLTLDGAGRYDPKMVEMRAKLARANKKQQKTAGRALKGNSRILAAERDRQAAWQHLAWNRSQLLAAREAVLAGLGPRLAGGLDWAEVEAALGPELKQLVIGSGLKLLTARVEYRQTLRAIQQRLQTRLEG